MRIVGVIESLAKSAALARFSSLLRPDCAKPNRDCAIKSATSSVMRYFSLKCFKNPIIFSTFAGVAGKNAKRRFRAYVYAFFQRVKVVKKLYYTKSYGQTFNYSVAFCTCVA